MNVDVNNFSLSNTHIHSHTKTYSTSHTHHVPSLLQDDGPRDNPSDSTPITLHVDSLVIHRRDDGSFSIGGDKHTHTHTLLHISTSTSVLIHYSYTTSPIKRFVVHARYIHTYKLPSVVSSSAQWKTQPRPNPGKRAR